MCLILFAIGQHERYPLIIAANRDESYVRPAAKLAFWADAPHIAAGRDLEAGGTWLGITKRGRWAALTNYRRAGNYKEGAPSRGQLVSEYLLTTVPPQSYLERVQARAAEFNGFNLLVGQDADAYYFSNRSGQHRRVDRGAHGLSNHLLDTPWPKVIHGRKFLQTLPDLTPAALTDVLLTSLHCRVIPPDSDLPDTGVGLPRERVLAPPFIVSESYGTRASTVIVLDRTGNVSIVERSFGPLGQPLGSSALQFTLESALPGIDIAHST